MASSGSGRLTLNIAELHVAISRAPHSALPDTGGGGGASPETGRAPIGCRAMLPFIEQSPVEGRMRTGGHQGDMYRRSKNEGLDNIDIHNMSQRQSYLCLK